MTYVTWKLVHFPFNNGYAATGTELEGYYDVTVTKSIGDNRNSFKFKITNFNNNFDNIFNVKDKIEIYRVVNTDTFTATDLLMIGTVEKVPFARQYNSALLRVEGNDFTESILSSVTFIDGTVLDIPTALKQALNYVNNINPNFQVTWNSDGTAIYPPNPTTKTDGVSSFPNVGERYEWKPIRALFERYSTNVYTEDDVNYFYLVDANNELIWQPRSTAVDFTFDATIDPYYTLKADKDLKDVVNFVVIKGGLDPAGKPIQTRVDDAVSRAKVGFKFKYLIARTNYAADLVALDMAESYGTDKEEQTSNFPKEVEDGTSFTTSWKSKINKTVSGFGYSVTLTKGNPAVINEGSAWANKRAYTAVIHAETKEALRREAESYIALRKFGKLKIDLEVKPGEYQWNLGDNIEFNIPTISDTLKTMRVVEIQYGQNNDTFSFEEDVGTIGV